MEKYGIRNHVLYPILQQKALLKTQNFPNEIKLILWFNHLELVFLYAEKIRP